MKLDHTDLILLRALQRDGRATNVELAEQAHLSESSCLRRVRQLEANGALVRRGGDVRRAEGGARA